METQARRSSSLQPVRSARPSAVSSPRAARPMTSVAAVLEDVAGDDDALDLVRSLEDPVDAGIAIEPFGPHLRRVSHASVELYGPVHDPIERLRAEVLADRRLAAEPLPCVAHPRGAVHHVLDSVGVRRHLGKHELYRLEVLDLPAERLALPGVLHTAIDGVLGGSEGRGGQAEAADVQHAE